MFTIRSIETVHVMGTAGEFTYAFIRIMQEARQGQWMLSHCTEESFCIFLAGWDVASPLPHDSPNIRIWVSHPLGVTPAKIPPRTFAPMVKMVFDACCSELAATCPTLSRCVCVLGGTSGTRCTSAFSRPRRPTEFSIHGTFEAM